MRHSEYLREQAEKLQLLEEFAEDRGEQFQAIVDGLGQSLRSSVKEQYQRWKKVLDRASADQDTQTAHNRQER